MPISFCQNFGQVELAFETYEPKPGQIVYYVRPLDRSFKGFFMEKINAGNWKVVNRHIVPWEILCLEHFMSMAIIHHREGLPHMVKQTNVATPNKTRVVYTITRN